MFLFILEDGELRQAAEITDDDRQQIADGTLTVVKAEEGQFHSLDSILNEATSEDEEDEWEDIWNKVIVHSFSRTFHLTSTR